jgi:tight adherence protein C
MAPYAGLVAGVVSAILCRRAVRTHRRARITLLAAGAAPPEHPHALARWLDRLGGSRLVAPLGSNPRLADRARLAGVRWRPERLAAARLVVAATCVIGTLPLALETPIAIALVVAAAALALRFPDLVLARLARRRQSTIERQVPDLVELLLVTTEAGLSAPIAFRRSADVLGPPLGNELHTAVREMDLGVPWRTALERMGEGTQSPGMRALGSSLARSQRLGASTGPALRSLAEDLRAARRVRMEEQARRAPVKMLFPLVFLVLPAFLLLTVGPVLVATIRSLH